MSPKQTFAWVALALCLVTCEASTTPPANTAKASDPEGSALQALLVNTKVTSDAIETFGPLPGKRLGVIRGGKLHCLDVVRGAWRRCSDWQALALPSDTRRVLGNDRVIALVRAGHIEYFDEQADSRKVSPLAIEKDWSPQNMTNGEYSTEPEMSLVHGGQLKIRLAADPDRNADLRLECPEAQGRRIFGLLGPIRWALIGQADLIAVTLNYDKATRTMRCVREPSLDWTAPEGTDEISVIGLDYLASRKGSNIQFWDYRRAQGQASKRWSLVSPSQERSPYFPYFPELSLDKVMVGPDPEAKSTIPLRRLNDKAMQALTDSVVPSKYAEAEPLDGRFLRVLKKPEADSSDRQQFGVVDIDGTEVIHPIYTEIEYDRWHRRFKVTKNVGDTSLSGFLDEVGQVVVPVEYEQLNSISNMGSEPTVITRSRGKYGYLNFVSGKILVAPEYDALQAGANLIDGNGDGVLIGGKNGKMALLDTNGKALTLFVFERFKDARGGLIGIMAQATVLIKIADMKIVEAIPIVDPSEGDQTAMQLVGIGVKLNFVPDQPGVLIERIFENGPAARGDLKAKDLIIAVDGRKVTDMTQEQTVKAIRGAVGTTVSIQVQRDGRQWLIKLKRTPIEVQ
jgi:hypothetical protein